MAPVEQILEATASRSVEQPPRRDGRIVVSHALWLCACETMDESPVWLVYAVGEDGIGWQRIPPEMEVSDVVEAEHLTGCHPAPERVLAWLRGESPHPWWGRADFPEHTYIYEEIRRRICSS